MLSTTPDQPKPGQFTAMISSTSHDLPQHREVVMKACIDAGVFPIGMESLPARDATGLQVSLEMVDKADIYIGIYAWRYGWVPKGKDKSVTEMEFDRALERQSAGKLDELLIFIAHDDHPFTKKDIETDGDAQKKLEAFKKRACEGRGRRSFASVEELRRLVSEALHHFLKRQTSGSPSSFDIPDSSLLPHNLPALQPFFGRTEELRKIADALDPESRTWGALIDGPGGMGKTSLAVRAAQLCTPEQFERIVFVSLKSRELDDDGVRDLSGFLISGLNEMLNELARELGHGDIAKAVETERPRLLLDVLRGTRTLLILDNLESLLKRERDIVFTFVKKLPVGCKAILTSRGRIGSGAEELILEKLDQDAALQTLAKLAETNVALAATSEAERVTLYTQTGGKPLLLRWTAGQIGRGSCVTFADAIAFLRSCQPDNDPLEFIFGDLVHDFTPAETAALCALTYFTLPAKVEHIAAVAGVERTSSQARGRAEAGQQAESGGERLRLPIEATPRPAVASTGSRSRTSPGSAASHASTSTSLTESAILTALKSLTNRSLVVPDGEFQTFTLVPLVADYLRKAKPEVITETGDRLEQHAYALVMENGLRNYERFPVLDAA